MQRNVVETILGAVVLLIAGGFLFFFQKTAEIRHDGGYEISAAFNKIDGLETGSPVRISGVKVGQVTSFKLNPDTYQAEVTMSINDGIKIPKDTAAVIASAGLLDGKFMTLEPGSDDEVLPAGGKIEYTQSTPSLEQLLGQVIFSLTDKKKDAPEGPATPQVPEMP